MSREDLSSRQVGYATEKAYPGIRHTADLQAPRQWSLPSSLIVSTTSGILKDYPLLHSHREREEREREREREKSEQSLFISVRPCNNWMDRETPAREIDTAMSVENHATTSLTSDVRSPRTLAFMWRGALIWSRERSTLARSSYARV